MTDAPQMDAAPVDPHAECTVQLVELETKWKRAVADYANREKELAREREDFARFCTVDLIRDFLPIVDAVGAAAGGKTSGVDGKTPDVEEPASGVELAPTGASGEPVARQGFRAIQVLLHNFLKRHDVEPIGAVGDRVDYLLHEVVGIKQVPKDFSPSRREGEREGVGQEKNVPGTVLEVVQVGYTMHGKLLRPAKVIVCEEKK